MNKHYSLIRAACNTACPELMELAFGCEIYVHYIDHNIGSQKAVNGIYKIVYSDNDKIYLQKGLERHYANIYKIQDGESERYKYKILGHPPELRHVLRALDKLSIYDCTIELDGKNIVVTCQKDKACVYLDLEKPLHEQSEETLEFLASLFPNPEKDI